MFKVSNCQRLFVLEAIFVSTFVISNAYVVVPNKPQMNSLENYDQFLSLSGQNPPGGNTNTEENIRFTEKVLEWLDQLDKLDENKLIAQALQSSKGESISPVFESELKVIRDRRQAMGTYNNNYFKHIDSDLARKLASKFIGKGVVSKSGCMSSLLRMGMSFQELIQAQKFCSLHAK